MDLEQRRKVIIEFITNNPGCNQQDIVRHLAGKVARQTALNTVDGLEEDKIIYWETLRENSRDHHHYVKQDNILVSVSRELDKFDKNFFSALIKVKRKFDRLYSETWRKHGMPQAGAADLSPFQPVLNVLSQLVEIFYEVVDVYMLRCILKWPWTVKKDDVIKKLYSILFSKINYMQFRMSQILSSTKAGDFYSVMQLSVYQRIYATANIQRHFDKFKLAGIDEIDALLDTVWDINRDFRQISYPEPTIYKWDFNYEKDSWKKLLDLQRIHPDQTYQNFVKKKSV